jgi:Tol biopolymer transport system component
MNIDGNNLKQLTNGNTETFPDISPDGQWIAYTLIDNSVPTVWKVAIDGGESIRLTDKDASDPSISPDGKLIACYYKENLESYRKIAIIPFEGGTPIKTFAIPLTAFIQGGIRWTPDGRALTYIDNQDGISNILSQSLEGGDRKKLTDFTSGQIFRFAWSPDGKQLAFERGFNVNDVVLISDFD